jgi:hypothetical protein
MIWLFSYSLLRYIKRMIRCNRHYAAWPVHTPDAISYPCIASIFHSTNQYPLAHHCLNLDFSRLCNCSSTAKFIHRRSSPALDQHHVSISAVVHPSLTYSPSVFFSPTDQSELLTHQLLIKLSLIRRVRRYRAIGVAYGTENPAHRSSRSWWTPIGPTEWRCARGGKSKHRVEWI